MYGSSHDEKCGFIACGSGQCSPTCCSLYSALDGKCHASRALNPGIFSPHNWKFFACARNFAGLW
jgi:hypothetical protein